MSSELKSYRLRLLNNLTDIIEAHSIQEALTLASEKYDIEQFLTIYPINPQTFL